MNFTPCLLSGSAKTNIRLCANLRSSLLQAATWSRGRSQSQARPDPCRLRAQSQTSASQPSCPAQLLQR
eukprot:13659436-Alexandrium_andersonii.AAC.1